MPFGAERGQRQVFDLVAPSLGPSERVEVVLSDAFDGPSPWFLAAVSVLLILLAHSYGVVLTNERVILVTRSKMTGRPLGVDKAFPRAAARVVEYRRGNLWSVLRLALATGSELKLNIRRPVRNQADELVRALGGQAPLAG